MYKVMPKRKSALIQNGEYTSKIYLKNSFIEEITSKTSESESAG